MLMFAVLVFCILCAIVIAFQLALIAGAPWGEFTMGGKWRGRLPIRVRLIPLISVLLLGAFILVVLARCGIAMPVPIFDKGMWIWLVVAYSALGIVANAATPSVRERKIWLPVVSSMFCSSLGIALSTAS